MNLQVFESWDNTSIGDKFVWAQDTSLVVQRYKDGPISDSLIGIEGASYYVGIKQGWNPTIAKTPKHNGWLLVTLPELKYDPMQQGDKDEDI